MLALLGAVLMTSATANAAQLRVGGGALTVVPTMTRCTDALSVTPGAIAADGTTAELVVTGLTPRCGGTPLALTVADAAGAVVIQAAHVVPTSGPAAVTVAAPSFAPASSMTAAATIATWAVPTAWTYTAPPQTVASCVVRESGSGAAVPGTSCTLGAPSITWGSVHWQHLQVNLPVQLSTPLRPSQYVSFSFTIPTSGTPSWWSWADADVASTNFGSGAGGLTSRCSELPVVSGRTPNNYGGVGSLFLDLTTTGSAGVCLPG